MIGILENGDKNSIAYEDVNWQIREHCNRGYESWFTLHKRRRFFRLSWWSSMQQWGEYKPLLEFVKKWNEWPNVK